MRKFAPCKGEIPGVQNKVLTSNLGIGLAKQGKRVLLIDADAQGSLTASLGFTEPDKLKCIEARELMIALPESFIHYDHDYLLKKMTDEFKK